MHVGKDDREWNWFFNYGLSSSRRSTCRQWTGLARDATQKTRDVHARVGLDVNTWLTRRSSEWAAAVAAVAAVATASVCERLHESIRVAEVSPLYVTYVFSSHGISIMHDETTERRDVRARSVRPGSHLLPCADGSTEIKGIRTRNAAR